ncbi:hypothetical protein [Actinocorallia populi]|uniref:hypothetical protein n=1 Tax=Actinocorallia populi TaxID=2079200 RepID=UPI000D0887AE|nr:hypothetical protein [Actinocorallia populi]
MRDIRVLLLTTAALAALCACGGEPGRPGVASVDGAARTDGTASAPASLTPEDASVRFARCMREQGVDMPDPVPGSGPGIKIDSGNRAAIEEAMEKCRPVLESAGVIPDLDDPAVKDAQLEFARCMREHGVDMPDPGEGGGIRIPEGLNEERTREAGEACRHLIQRGGPR